MRKFIKLESGAVTGVIVKEGEVFNKKRFGRNSPDETYFNAGLLLIEEADAPEFNVESEDLIVTYERMGNIAYKKFEVRSKDTVQTKAERYEKLEIVFNSKILFLKKMAINKPNMTNKEAINNQYEQYKSMYESAKNQYFDTETNLAIISNYESSSQFLAEVTLLLNTVKTKLENDIESDTINIDALLKDADALVLTISEITPTKIAEIKTKFGI